MVGMLARRGEFKWVLMELVDKIKRGDGSSLVSGESFRVLIWEYARLGKISAAIRAFEFGNGLGLDRAGENLGSGEFGPVKFGQCRNSDETGSGFNPGQEIRTGLNWGRNRLRTIGNEKYLARIFGQCQKRVWTKPDELDNSGQCPNLDKKFMSGPGLFRVSPDRTRQNWGQSRAGSIENGQCQKQVETKPKPEDALGYFRSDKILPAVELELFDVLLNALCKYGHVREATECVDRRIHLDPEWVPSVGVYNVLLDGWFRVRNSEMVEKVWLRMRENNLCPDVSSYGVMVGGYCRMGLVDRAVELLGEMRRRGVRVDGAVYDLIVVSLARAGRLKEALRMMEVYMVLEHGPTLRTYNALVGGFCGAGDLVGAGKVLKMMTSRGVVPTCSMYSWFFRYFEKNGKVEDALSLYRKMMDSGYELDQRALNVVLKMLCEKEELELALEMTKEIRRQGQVLGPAISAMLIDLLCKNHRLKEAVVEFEKLIQSGFMPRHIVYEMLHEELKKKGLHKLALKLSNLMATVPRSTALPVTVEGIADMARQRRKTVIRRAKAMSDILKTSSDSRELTKRRGSRKRASGGDKGSSGKEKG